MKTLMNGMIKLVAAVLALIGSLFVTTMPMENGNEDSFMDLPGAESGGFDLPPWLVGAIAAIAVAAGLAFLLFKLAKLVIKAVKYLIDLFRKTEPGDNIAYTTVVEKLGTARIKRSRPGGGAGLQPRYSMLRTEAERVRFIYREYVKRARRGGMTDDRPGGTPNDILCDIAANAPDGFPLPGSLGDTYNAARYGAEGAVTSGADGLKKRLL